MRKIVIAIMSTISAVVLVVSFDASRRDTALVTTAAPDDQFRDEESAGDQVIPTGDPSAGQPADAPSPSEAPSAPSQTPSEPAEAPSEPAEAPSEAEEASGAGSSATSGTFTGDAVQTHWGPVQVRIVVKNGKIVRATAIEFPQENRHDIEINSWAIPQLEQATVDSNGRQVDSYSGATVTCDGYRASLQSALDKAHL